MCCLKFFLGNCYCFCANFRFVLVRPLRCSNLSKHWCRTYTFPVIRHTRALHCYGKNTVVWCAVLPALDTQDSMLPFVSMLLFSVHFVHFGRVSHLRCSNKINYCCSSVFRFPFSFPAWTALLRLPHSGVFVLLYLAMAFLSAICFISEWSYPWRLGLITRCGGIYSPMYLFRIAAPSTPFSGLLG